MRQPVHGAVTIHAVILEAARIGLVVADGEAFLREPVDERTDKAVVPVPEKTRLPRTFETPPARREAVHRDEDGHHIRVTRPGERLLDGGMIGRMERGNAMREFRRIAIRVDVAVVRHDGAVGEFHHDGRIVLAAIEIDKQARKAREHRRTVEIGGHACDTRRTDIPGDVALKFRRRKTESAVTFRQRIGGVIADHQKPRRTLRVNKFERLKRSRLWNSAPARLK